MKNEGEGNVSQVLLLLALLFTSLFYLDSVPDKTLSPRLILLSFFMLFYFATFLVSKKKKVTFQVNFFSVSLGLFTLSVLLSGIQATNHSVFWVESGKVILFFALFLVFVKLNEHLSFRIKSIQFVLILFLISLIWFSTQVVSLETYSRNELYKLVGISGHKNLYASFVWFCLIISFYGLFNLSKVWRIIAIVSIVLQFSIVLFIQTRTVWIAAIIFILIVVTLLLLRSFVKQFSLRRTVLFFAATLVLLNVFFISTFPSLIEKYANTQVSDSDIEKVTDLGTLKERQIVWQKTYEVIQSNFWFGVGADNWKIVHTKNSVPNIYKVTDLNVNFQRPHNDFLWIFSEYGIIGLNFFLIFILLVFFFLLKLYVTSGKKSILVLVSGIVSIAVISFSDFPKERVEHLVLITLVYALGVWHIVDSKLVKNSVYNVSTPLNILLFLGLSFYVLVFTFNLKGDFYFNKMYEEREKRNHLRVIEMCDKSFSIFYSTDPTSIPIHWYKGNAFASMENYDAALFSFKQALKHTPYNPYVLNDLGSAFYSIDEVDSAIFYFKKAASINARFDDPILNLIALYINEGKYKEALKLNETVLHESERRNAYLTIIKEELKNRE